MHGTIPFDRGVVAGSYRMTLTFRMEQRANRVIAPLFARQAEAYCAP
jgi:hypothetical protein